MANKKFPQSGLPIRKTVDLLPNIFRTDVNDKFLSGVVDPLVQPGVLQKTVGYIGKRYGKTYNGKDIYVNSDETLRSRYQLEPGVVYRNEREVVENFYDYLDFKNQLKFFGNEEERDDLITSQEHYSWNPPIDWDKFINYREYYWEPAGPPSVQVKGQSVGVASTYKVKTSVNSFIFTPDGYTNNPTIILYRGQTYKFKIDAPGDGFVIRTNYDVGTLAYRPQYPYSKNQITISGNKLWRALVDIPAPGPDSITESNPNWEYVEPVSGGTALDYNIGVKNNRIENGTLTFEVPFNAPDVLYYQSVTDPNKFGQFVVANAESYTKINVEKEIIGKTQYKSSNGVEFTNGLVVEFVGEVTPAEYASDTWLVEGVGTSITLTKFTDLIVPKISSTTPEILFDNEGFDTEPFDDATQYPGQKDYITISRNSKDSNPWSRYNRWFHRSVLEYAYKVRGQDFAASETSRAKRPIIEFKPNIQLFNHGSTAKKVVDYIDNFTTDVFSNIEGSLGYNIDGEFLFEGARVLVIADTDSLANNKIYEVQFITHNGRRQIHLKDTSDTQSINGECVLVQRGTSNGGLMFHFNGTNWVKSQEKTAVNQPPLFDAFDSSGISFSDTESYPVSTFAGTKLLSYKVGNSVVDTELGFSLSYLNIDNVGDIQFNWDWDTQVFYYTQQQTVITTNISTGFYRLNHDERFENGWVKSDITYFQPIIDSVVVSGTTNSISINPIDWSKVTDDTNIKINFYKNGEKFVDDYTRVRSTFTFANTTFADKDVVSIKVVSEIEPDHGFYQIPLGLEKNPLNEVLTSFTLGQAVDHIVTSVEFNNEFSGTIPGISNLRDITDYQKHAKRFLKHSGMVPLAVSLLCDKTSNVIKSIQYAKKSYTEFKNNFIARAAELPFNTNIPNFVDDIITDLTKTKTSSSPFAGSDMIGTGAFTSIKYKVDDVGIKTFSLSTKFSLTEVSQKAVYVYINEQQLLHGKDYEFNATFGFVTIKVELTEGDNIEIREYVSTAFNHIPPTPTSIGLYKKYTPMKFVDDTYVEPVEVIQGHDGSITVAYGDFRDDLLLELEYRIYNNIKVEYNRDIFDIDSIVKGYYDVGGIYTKAQLDNVVIQEFLKWIQNTNINYTLNDYFDTENSFTYTYSNMTDPKGTTNLPGWWRGVYTWAYDTDRPHRCPWEMLGFSEKPDWWEEEYGPAPYTKGNLLLWEDLADGIIRQGTRAGTHDRYKRPGLLNHIPVDGDGKLLSPLSSGFAGNFTLVNNTGSFSLGDIAPVEYAWRASSEWPFAVVIAMSLLKPFEFITDAFDLSKVEINKIGQTVSKSSGIFMNMSDISLPGASTAQSIGLAQYLTGYLKFRGLDVAEYESKLRKLDVSLSTRLSGFADKEQQKYLLDSKNPKSASSSIFIPPENYDIIFNVSSPISSVAYSGVIIEKQAGGWVVTGYDDVHPYFNYLEPIANQKDPIISVGGVSESFMDWQADKTYSNGQLVRFGNDYFRALKTHNSGLTFDSSIWQKLPAVPIVGAVEAQRRKTFNTFRTLRMVYGTKLPTIQSVVDFLLGYDAYLQSIGFTFNRYDPSIESPQDWITSCKEFMFWTKHNWAIGSLLALSPSAEKIDISVPVGVADSLLDSFYDYQVLKSDGKVLPPANINVNRSFQNITVETTNTTDGIYYLKVYFVLKEHVALFSDKTVFNDVIYDKTTGYRQERIKTQGFITVDWDGDYTSPGFLFDNVNIQPWMPFTDYKSGDIVLYRSYNWTSLINQPGVETFDDTKWVKLDSNPEKQLIANFDYKINQFEDYFDVAADGLGNSQRTLARHTVGYQPREYLQNLSEDPVTQFQLYQGFIKEKGTANAITKVFNKLSNSASGSVELNEEWAFRVGRFGGVDQLTESEITMYKDRFEINPQPIIITNTVPNTVIDRYYRIPKSDFTIDPKPFDLNINPTATIPLNRIAGYVKSDHVDFVVKTRDDILALDIAQFSENNHIWVTFDQASWTVLRYNESPLLVITDVTKSETLVTIKLNRFHSFKAGDIIGIKRILNLTGFFKIVSVDVKSVTVEVAEDADTPEFDNTSVVNVSMFTPARFDTFESLDLQASALLKPDAKLWIDDNLINGWEVVQKKKQFNVKELVDSGIAEPLHLGTKVVYSESNRQTIASIPETGYVMVYAEVPGGIGVSQVLLPPESIKFNLQKSFGKSMATSSDGKWLFVGSPDAGFIPTFYKGNFNPSVEYFQNEIVLHDNQLWRAETDLASPETPSSISTQWSLADIISPTTSGTDAGLTSQGVVTIYEWTGQRWSLHSSVVSPRPAADENFGFDISIGQTGSTYFAAITAPGAYGQKGRVYILTGDSANWKYLSVDNQEFSLPEQVALADDGSSITYVAEMIKLGDRFGTKVSLSSDTNILVISSPNADGQYFENYRGVWKSDTTYIKDDVVQFEGNYFKLYDDTSTVGVSPIYGLWNVVGDSTAPSSGKVFVYRKDIDNKYRLVQTIDSASIALLDDTVDGNSTINVGDQFGFSIELDYTGSTLVASSPRADINFQNQGSAYVFKTASTDDVEFRLTQKLESFEIYPNELFGQSVSISSSGDRIVIGAKNSPFKVLSKLDTAEGTIFDQGRTRFIERSGYAGAAYVYERKNSQYFLVEKLEAELSPYESFGYTIDCTDSAIAVGSPDFVEPVFTASGVEFDGPMVGTVRLFKKAETVNSWETLETESALVDISKINSIALYDNEKNVKIQDIDYVDPAKLKILNIAEKEIKFKTMYDPAVYSIGTEEQTIDESIAWTEKHVGELWWDISAVKWKHYEQGDLAYRISNWSSLAEGASIDVYEWVQSVLLPSEWSALADTNEGLAEGISGQPLYPNNNVYTVKEFYNEVTGEISGSLYFYWVKSKTTIPVNDPSRSLSAATVASAINAPANTGIPFLAIVDKDKFLAYNFDSVITSDTVSLNIEHRKTSDRLNPIHNEYQLLTEGLVDSLPTEKLETKWIDSLVGTNKAGETVPDVRLPAKQKYGISFRPRQSMFVDRYSILKTTVTNINTVLNKEAFTDIINFSKLNLVDEVPSPFLNLYDIAVDTDTDLISVGTVRIKQARLQVNIINGEIDTIDVLESGFGYKNAPPVIIEGDGEGALAIAEIDSQGRVIAVNVKIRGRKYSNAIATVRQFSVLVNSDSTTNNFWTIYAWDDVRKVFFKSRTQAYDTTRYWNYADWWKSDYSPQSRVVAEINSIYEELNSQILVNDLIRVKEYGSGGWAVFEKINNEALSFTDRYLMVGRENGTIQLDRSLYDTTISGIGYDNVQSFDIKLYDIENSIELRNILQAVKEDIFVGDYAVEWNKLFFTGVRYAFSEQQYIDWAFKTSFLSATHNVGPLAKKLNYKNDSLDSYQEYIDEVKPYRTTVREYISKYSNLETSMSATTDFDVPPRYSVIDNHAVPVTLTDETIQTYPWKWWLDNSGYSITSIRVYNPGSGYIQPPNVLIEGSGTGAIATAYISNGSVSGISVINPGSGFTKAPTITLVGGNGSNTDVAKAVAIIGDTKARTFNVGLKFDRLSRDGLYANFDVADETFVANGYSAVFELKFAPTRDKSKVKILKNNQLVLDNEYSIILYRSTTSGYSLLKGKIVFAEVPLDGDNIIVTYEKNDELLDAVNRINKYYSPSSGMKGKDLGQLMTGIDYGGVQIQGTTFDVTGGWDALPWFTDNWDSVQSGADYYVICDGSTTSITLPFTPTVGQEINVYLKRAGTVLSREGDRIQTTGTPEAPVVSYEPEVKEQPTIRIDDPYFNSGVDSSTSTNPNAQMPTFIGDGVTNVIEIGQYVSTNDGDTLIFRPSDSDGSVTINDTNLLDTTLSGGSLNSTDTTSLNIAPNTVNGSYSTATGLNAEDISIDGGKFIGPDQVPAPEENVPGQVLDSVSIKVFTTDPSGAVPLNTSLFRGDSLTRLFKIGQKILESSSLIVYVDKIKLVEGVDYSIDFENDLVEFSTAPVDGAIIELISFGLGGVALLDYQEFIADGTTSLFLTNAYFADTGSVSVTVNGVYVDTGFVNSTGVVDVKDRTLIQFGTAPLLNSIVKIVSIGHSAPSSGIIRVFREEFNYDGSTSSFELLGFVNAPGSTALSSMVVEVDGIALRGVDTVTQIYDGVTDQFVIGVDPEEGPGAVLTTNITVSVNNKMLAFVQDYVYDGATKTVTITSDLVKGDLIKIENDFRSEYSISNNIVTLSSSVIDRLTQNDDSTIKNVINVTWFSEYPSMQIISDEFVGGKVNYELGFIPLGISYVWAYKNGERLVQDKDYYISIPRGVAYLTNPTTENDIIKFIVFGSKIYHDPYAYEIHKDMLNVYHYNRYSLSDVKLATDLHYYDQEVIVTDASGLADPIRSRNIPGIIVIGHERIEYLQKNGNILSQLRRGVQGTAIAELHSAGSSVIDVSVTEVIPYKENQDRVDFVSDGSTSLVGPLNFVPTIGTRLSEWTRVTIPEENGPCDQFEVFAGGKRLRKDPIVVYNEFNGSASPDADEIAEAEFSVDGVSPYIRLTDKVPAGTRISVIRKVGSVWYELGDNTASKGVTLIENNTPIAAFIAKKSTILPE